MTATTGKLGADMTEALLYKLWALALDTTESEFKHKARELLARQPAAIGRQEAVAHPDAEGVCADGTRFGLYEPEPIDYKAAYAQDMDRRLSKLNTAPAAPSVEQDERGAFDKALMAYAMEFSESIDAEKIRAAHKRVMELFEARAASTSANVARLTPDAKGTDAARRYLADLFRNENGSNQYADYIRHELAGDFAWELVNRLLSPNLAQGAEKLCTICNGYGRYQDGNSGTEADGYAPNIVECECTDEERRHEYRDAASPAQHKSGWHPDFVTALYDNADPDKRYTMDQMREYADAFHRSRIDAANVAQGAESVAYAAQFDLDVLATNQESHKMRLRRHSHGTRTVPLYTAPPAQTALTDAARDAAAAKWATANTPIREALAFIDGFDAARALTAAQSASGDTQ